VRKYGDLPECLTRAADVDDAATVDDFDLA